MMPFDCLGRNGMRFYYRVHSTGQIISLAPGRHRPPSIYALAPLSWWDGNFPGPKGVDWDQVMNTLFQLQREVGFYLLNGQESENFIKKDELYP